MSKKEQLQLHNIYVIGGLPAWCLYFLVVITINFPHHHLFIAYQIAYQILASVTFYWLVVASMKVRNSHFITWSGLCLPFYGLA